MSASTTASHHRPVGSRAGYLRQWSELHGGATTEGLVGAWLGGVYRLARPLARLGVPADALTIAGLAIALAAVPLVGLGGDGVLLAILAIVLSGLLDGLDGAVALITRRSTRWGYLLDSLCDRLSDAGYVAALWVAGAPGWVCALGGGLAWLHEYVRARAVAGGVHDIAVVTVAERPTRIIVTGTFLLGAWLFAGQQSLWATLGALVWAVLGIAGLMQLLHTLRPILTD